MAESYWGRVNVYEPRTAPFADVGVDPDDASDVGDPLDPVTGVAVTVTVLVTVLVGCGVAWLVTRPAKSRLP